MKKLLKRIDVAIKKSNDLSDELRVLKIQAKGGVKMKHWTDWLWRVIVIAGLLFLLFLNRAEAYTYDGILDPQTLTQDNCLPVGMQEGAVVFTCKKDDFESMLWVYKDMIMQYAYRLGDDTFLFRLNKEGHYQQILPEVKNEKSSERQI